MEIYFFVFLSFLSSVVLSSTVDYKEETKHVFITVFHSYNERVRPYNYGKKPIRIWANLDFVDVIKVDTKQHVMDSIVDLRLKWEDKRLLWTSQTVFYITVNETTIWTPDIEFLNVVEPIQVLVKPRYVVIEKTGHAYINHRYRIKTACKGHNNTCSVKIGSNLFSKSEIIFHEAECTASDELLTSDMRVEVANITGNMSVIGEQSYKGPTKFSPKFDTSSCSVMSCDLTYDQNEMTKTEATFQENENNGQNDHSNNARQTIQQIGLVVFGICLFFAS